MLYYFYILSAHRIHFIDAMQDIPHMNMNPPFSKKKCLPISVLPASITLRLSSTTALILIHH